MLGLLGRFAVTVEVASRDDEVADLLARSDPAAIERLYDTYGRLAFTIAFRILGDSGTAEDVVQESFLAVWRRSESFDRTRGSLRTWLSTIVHRRAIDRLRGRSGRSRLDLPLETSAADHSVGDSFDVVAENLQRDEIRRALSELSADQRLTIELAYYGGLSQTEISEKLGIPLGTVKGRTRLALRRLRDALGDRGLEWAM